MKCLSGAGGSVVFPRMFRVLLDERLWSSSTRTMDTLVVGEGGIRGEWCGGIEMTCRNGLHGLGTTIIRSRHRSCPQWSWTAKSENLQ